MQFTPCKAEQLLLIAVVAIKKVLAYFKKRTGELTWALGGKKNHNQEPV